MKVLLLAIAFGLFSTAATAATVFYDFSTLSGPNQTSYTQTTGGVGVTVTATGGDVTFGANGLGVSGKPNKTSLGIGESLTFDFGTVAFTNLSGLVVEQHKKEQQFMLTIDGASQTYTIPAGNGSSTMTFDPSTLIALEGATKFTLSGLTDTKGKKGGLQLGGFTITTVPIPTSGAMLASALGFVYLRRRKPKPD